MKSCPACGHAVTESKRFCNHCGEKLADGDGAPRHDASAPAVESPSSGTGRVCPSCGKSIVKASATFCRFCGAALDGTPTTAAAPSAYRAPSFDTIGADDSRNRLPAILGMAVAAVVVFAVGLWVSLTPSQPGKTAATSPVSSRTGAPGPTSNAGRTTQPSTTPRVSATVRPIPAPVPSTVAAAPDRVAVSPDGLVAYYRFDGTLEDASGFGRHARPLGSFGMAPTNAFLGQSLQCITETCLGVDRSVFPQLEQFTITVWVLWSGEPYPIRLLGNAESYGLVLDGAVRLSLGFTDGASRHGVNAPSRLQPDLWQFVAGTYDGETLALYRNGNRDGIAIARNRRPNLTGNPFLIGAGDPNKRGYSLLDEVRVYSRALQYSEIQELVREDFQRRQR